jgi:membrane dipeptidase
VRRVIARTAAIDIHSHAGGIASVRRVIENLPFLPVAEPMRAGGFAIACLAVVSDGPTHRVMRDGRIHPYRNPEPGELATFGAAAFARLHALVAAEGLAVIADANALRRASAAAPSAIIAAEGGDFLEGSADRVDEAYERWTLRHLQLTHYRVNELGDIQTEAPVHGGLTDAGAEVIRRCNRRGIVVDVAHGTFDLVKRAAAVTSRPLILSHTSLTPSPGSRSRQIGPDHAKAIAATGGVIGVWPPAGIYPDIRAMVAGMARLADLIGVDHVGFGSDMLGLVGPSAFPSYAELPSLAAALLAAGFRDDDAAKILGGNYARVFAAAAA